MALLAIEQRESCGGGMSMALPRHQRWFYSGWNGAIEHCLGIFNEAPQHLPLGEEGHRLLIALSYVLGEALRDQGRIKARTNAELAKRFGCSRRTIQYWRAQGCPFEDRVAYVFDWLARRRSLPAGTRQKFANQLEARGVGATATAAMRRELGGVQGAMELARRRF